MLVFIEATARLVPDLIVFPGLKNGFLSKSKSARSSRQKSNLLKSDLVHAGSDLEERLA